MAPRHHILAVVVENKPGVLARVAGLFSRRGFNIFSLAVSPTDDERYSRMTVVVDVESAPLEQVTKQLDKLINVLQIAELAPEKAVERELMLATVGASEAGERSEIGTLASIFEARILDVAPEAMTLMAAGTPEKLDSLESLLRPYRILAIQRTGRIALPRLELSGGAGSAAGRSGVVLRTAPGGTKHSI